MEEEETEQEAILRTSNSSPRNLGGDCQNNNNHLSDSNQDRANGNHDLNIDCYEDFSDCDSEPPEDSDEFYHEDGLTSFLSFGDGSTSLFSLTEAVEEETEDDEDELEYEYEPGISLRNLEFAKHPDLESSTCKGEHCADYENDLQLAAELGKTLLERNKELENTLKQQQAIIDDQSQEIEYLTKQTTALREVNDSRLKIYEQLEVSISEFETVNKKLVEENKADKAQIKSLSSTVNRLELRCEDLQRRLEEEESRNLLSEARRRRRGSNDNAGAILLRRQSTRHLAVRKRSASWGPHKREEMCQDWTSEEEEDRSSEGSQPESGIHRITPDSADESVRIRRYLQQDSGYSSGSTESHLHHLVEDVTLPAVGEKTEPPSGTVDDSALQQVVLQNEATERRLRDLEEAIVELSKENTELLDENEELRASQDERMKTVQDEVLCLDSVRKGKLCRRCLGNVEEPSVSAILIDRASNLANKVLEELRQTFQDSDLRAYLSDRTWIDRLLGFLAAVTICLGVVRWVLVGLGGLLGLA